MLKMIHGRIEDRDSWDKPWEDNSEDQKDNPGHNLRKEREKVSQEKPGDNDREKKEKVPQGKSGRQLDSTFHESGRSLRESLPLGQALWPAPFEPGLEYNSPAHGNWNIVHMGMLLPQAHQIYVCAANCNRGVVLTAAEMDAMDRFSFIELEEEDLYQGNMEDLVIRGVGEILHRLEYRPRIILLFTVCLHHFMGTDLPFIYETLRSLYPDIFFVDCYMDCILQKEGLTPDQKLRIKLYDILDKGPVNPGQINIIGNDFPLADNSDIKRILKAAGKTWRDLTEMTSLDEYLQMGESVLNICTYPLGRPGLEALSEKLEIPGLYLPMVWDYEEIDRQLALLCRNLGLDESRRGQKMEAGIKESVRGEDIDNIECELADYLKSWLDITALKDECEKSLEETARFLKGRRLALDASATPHVLGLARLLLSHGMEVTHIYADAFLPEEEEAWHWLKEHAPHVEICSVIHHNMRVRERAADEKMLAIGQKAAYFHQTPYFVNMVEGGGLHGYDGILTMLARIRQAAVEKKDIEDTIRRKGLGCPCIL